MAKVTNKAPRDVQQEVTNAIIAQIEGGVMPWAQPWRGTGIMPINGLTRKAYRGANVLFLWGASMSKGYAANIWYTYKQAESVGGQVRKGETGTTIVKWLPIESKEKEADGSSKRGGMIARAYTVFNLAQIDGIPETPNVAQLDESARVDIAESFFSAITFRHTPNGNAAYYTPSTDTVTMPAFGSFVDAARYYDVLAHELAHWTGADSRLKRLERTPFGSEAYAQEELTAELSAAFVMATLGLSSTPRPDHASYIASWLGKLKGDKRYIFTAASKAQAATDYLFDLASKGGFVLPDATDSDDVEAEPVAMETVDA